MSKDFICTPGGQDSAGNYSSIIIQKGAAYPDETRLTKQEVIDLIKSTQVSSIESYEVGGLDPRNEAFQILTDLLKDPEAKITDISVNFAKMCKAVKGDFLNLLEQNTTLQKIHFKVINQDVVSSVCAFIAKNKNLNELVLPHFYGEDELVLNQIANAIKENPCIEKIELSYAYLNDIKIIVGQSATIKSLNLMNAHVRKMSDLILVLKSMHSLEHLDLSSIYMYDQAQDVKLIADFIEGNKSLKSLNLVNNRLEVDIAHITKAIKNNKIIECVSLGRNELVLNAIREMVVEKELNHVFKVCFGDYGRDPKAPLIEKILKYLATNNEMYSVDIPNAQKQLTVLEKVFEELSNEGGAINETDIFFSGEAQYDLYANDM